MIVIVIELSCRDHLDKAWWSGVASNMSDTRTYLTPEVSIQSNTRTRRNLRERWVQRSRWTWEYITNIGDPMYVTSSWIPSIGHENVDCWWVIQHWTWDRQTSSLTSCGSPQYEGSQYWAYVTRPPNWSIRCQIWCSHWDNLKGKNKPQALNYLCVRMNISVL